MLPPTNLAIAYATPKFRASFALLLQIDARFEDILRNAREPMIAQIKMAWWREAFAKEAHLRPKGEPLLQALNDDGEHIPSEALEALASAWEGLLGSDGWSHDIVDRHAADRARAIFQTYATWVGCSQDVQKIGHVWAIDALRPAFQSRMPGNICAPVASLPTARILRPLSILAMSVRHVSGPRMIWHAMTGR